MRTGPARDYALASSAATGTAMRFKTLALLFMLAVEGLLASPNRRTPNRLWRRLRQHGATQAYPARCVCQSPGGVVCGSGPVRR